MKKRGFTLIELLAVIVILAIIALIATPIVMNVIENARKGAAERTVENYIDAVELAIASKRLEGPVLSDGTYNLTALESEDYLGIIEVNGDKPSSGSVKIVNGTVATVPETTMKVGDYTVSYNSEGKLVASKGSATVKVYSWSEEDISLNAPIDPTDTTKFKTNPSELGKDYYLKHELDADNEVTASYACVKYGDNEEACVRGGMDAEGNSYYEENLAILESLDSLENDDISCDIDSTRCYVGSIRLRVDGHNVDASDDYGSCTVGDVGSSSCMTYQ